MSFNCMHDEDMCAYVRDHESTMALHKYMELCTDIWRKIRNQNYRLSSHHKTFQKYETKNSKNMTLMTYPVSILLSLSGKSTALSPLSVSTRVIGPYRMQISSIRYYGPCLPYAEFTLHRVYLHYCGHLTLGTHKIHTTKGSKV